MDGGHDFISSDEAVGLRYFMVDDVADVTEACQDPEIVSWTATIPTPYTQAHARGWIGLHEDWRRHGSAHHFAIIDRSDGRASGSIGLESLLQPPVQVGYWVAPWARNRGFASRAVRLASAWAFDNLGCQEIMLVTKVGNGPSERVAQNGGFELLDELDEYHPENARSSDASVVRRWVLRQDV
jgi:RimJ/RimL family protein N-acetyltransferase